LLEEVLRLRGEGHDVQIVSLDPLSVAHRYLAAPGVAAAGEIGLLARRADAVVIQLEPGLPVRRSAGRSERVAALMALTAVLRRCPDVTLRLCDPDDLPGGHGGRAGIELWKAAGRIEVYDEDVRAGLAKLLGPLGERVSIAAARRSDGESLVASGRVGWGDGADATASDVTAIVRARAASERASLARRGRLPIRGGVLDARVPQWQWLPAPGAGVPDLGPIRSASGRRRRRRRASAAGSEPMLRSLRRAATSALAAGERHASTRPAAHLAHLAWVELRGARRRAV
jgi:hypothetical protein